MCTGVRHDPARGSHSHRACRTIYDLDQNEIKGSTSQFVHDQGALQRGDQTAHRRVRLKFLARISSSQGPFLGTIK